jgi:hypothetical protein
LTIQEVNRIQQRVIKSDARNYDKVIEQTDCDVFREGHGPASEILAVMAQMAAQYAYQVKDLAKMLSKTSLRSTCDSFYEFQKNYIQYDVDGRDQRLRTPSCLWNSRMIGGDCKSFTIMSGALCTAIGVKSIMRQIKVKGTEIDNRINHVFLIVPIDQENGSLNEGHYVIDGSSKINLEAPNYWKNDMEVDLSYQGMNGYHDVSGQNCSTGCDHGKNGKNTNPSREKINKEYNNLIEILQALSLKNADAKNMQSAGLHCYDLVSSGENPYLEFNKEGVIIENTLYPYNKSSDNPFELTEGMGFDYAALFGGSGGGASGGGGGLGGFDLSGIGSFIGSDSATGNAVGSVAGAGVGMVFGLPPQVGATVGGLIGGLFGGGSAFTAEKIEREILVITNYFETNLANFSATLKSGDFTRGSLQWSKILGFSELLRRTYTQKLSEGWNSTSSANLQKLIDTANVFKRSLEGEVKRDIEKLFSIVNTGQTIPMGGDEDITDFSQSGFNAAYVGNDVDIMVPLFNLTPIPGALDNNNTNSNLKTSSIGAPALLLGVGAMFLAGKYLLPGLTATKTKK